MSLMNRTTVRPFLTVLLLSFIFPLMASIPRLALKNTDKADIDSLLLSYQKMHMSFFNKDFAQIAKDSKEMKMIFSKIKNESLRQELNTTLMALTSLEDESLKPKIKMVHFDHMGLNLSSLIEKYELDHYNTYYCGGVKKTWIQDSSKLKEPHNPYTHMKNCGMQKTSY